MANVRIYMNKNVKMSPGKLASQAVHAALNAYGINHGSVVVLQGTAVKVKSMDTVIHDEGLTEIKPGSMTAGASLEEVEGYGKYEQWIEVNSAKTFQRQVITGPWEEVE